MKPKQIAPTGALAGWMQFFGSATEGCLVAKDLYTRDEKLVLKAAQARGYRHDPATSMRTALRFVRVAKEPR